MEGWRAGDSQEGGGVTYVACTQFKTAAIVEHRGEMQPPRGRRVNVFGWLETFAFQTATQKNITAHAESFDDANKNKSLYKYFPFYTRV